MSKKYENTETEQTQLFAMSKEFIEISSCKLTTSENLVVLANKLIDEVTSSFSVIKSNYDAWRAEYNKNLPTHERLFITPYLKVNSGVRRNLYVQWVRICSQSYLGKTNHGAKWQPREIKRNGGFHYKEQTLKTSLSSYTKKCLPYLMDAEHSLVYLREQTKIAASLFEISRTLKPTNYGLILVNKRLNELNFSDQQLLISQEDQLLELNAKFDPPLPP